MQIYSISIVHTPPSDTAVVLSNTSDLSSLGFFQRGSAAEFMAFLSKTIAERTPQGQRQVVQYQSYVAHIYNRGGEEQLAAVFITDQEYPTRVAFFLQEKILDEFIANIGTQPISFINPSSISFPEIDAYIQEYKDPRRAGTIVGVQEDELDETKIIPHKSFESVLLEGGEKLDNLVERSSFLSKQTKRFYTIAKKQNNACCIIM